MKFYVTGWQRPDGFKTAIVAEGRTLVHICILDEPVRLITRVTDVRRDFTPLEYRGNPYPLRRACKLFRASARAMGITKSALRHIRKAEQFTA